MQAPTAYPHDPMQRPDSPPPRQPSPDFLPAPLPYPRHPRRIHSQPKIKVTDCPPSPAVRAPRPLQPARSYDFLRAEYHALHRTDSNVSTLVASSPGSSRPPSLKDARFAPTHRRTRSVAFPNPSRPSPPSPPASESTHTLSVPDTHHKYAGPRHILPPDALSPVSIVLPDIDQPRSDVRFPPPPTDVAEETVSHAQAQQAPPALERHKSMGLACLKFFGIRTPGRRPQTRVTTTLSA